MRRIVDGDKAIVIRVVYIVDPSIGGRDLMKRVISPGRKLRVVSVNLADAENAGWRAAVMFFFSQASIVLDGETCAPSHAILAKQNVERPGYGFPIVAAVLPFKELQVAAHGIPRWRDPDDELGAVVRHAIGIGIAPKPKE